MIFFGATNCTDCCPCQEILRDEADFVLVGDTSTAWEEVALQFFPGLWSQPKGHRSFLNAARAPSHYSDRHSKQLFALGPKKGSLHPQNNLHDFAGLWWSSLIFMMAAPDIFWNQVARSRMRSPLHLESSLPSAHSSLNNLIMREGMP